MKTIWTIGHSSQDLDSFLNSLIFFEIQFLVDVRRYPGSRKFPHFNSEGSEVLWWRCHRSLISDVFKVNGWKVLHIMNENKIQEHPYTQAATVKNNQLSYKKSS